RRSQTAATTILRRCPIFSSAAGRAADPDRGNFAPPPRSRQFQGFSRTNPRQVALLIVIMADDIRYLHPAQSVPGRPIPIAGTRLRNGMDAAFSRLAESRSTPGLDP